jgi:undecaprenyl-diphosphatase
MDKTLLLWINQSWAHPWLDVFFRWVSERDSFALPLMVVILAYFARHYGKDGIKLWLMLILVVGLGDQLGLALKHIFEQARPCFDLANLVRQPGLPPHSPCGANLTGMPSNHALNYFNTATFIAVATRIPLPGIALFIVAVLVGLSRIYLGVHYPSQVLAGAAIGATLGFIGAWITVKYLSFMQRIRARDHDRY